MSSRAAIMRRPVKLWRIGEPWSKRPGDPGGTAARLMSVKTTADGMRSMAEGRKPAGRGFKELERKATIYGGIAALQAVGLQPWSRLNLSKVPKIKPRDDKSEKRLVNMVRRMVKLNKHKAKIRNLKNAAEYVRRQVNKEGLQKTAWSARGLVISEVALRRNAVATKARSVTATALTVSAISANVIPGVGQVVSSALAITSLINSAAQARDKVEKTRLENTATKFQVQFDEGLRNRSMQLRSKELRAELQAVQQEQKSIEEEARRDGEFYGKLTTVAVWGLTAGLGVSTIILAAHLYNRRRS